MNTSDNSELMPFYLPGTTEFVQALQLFLSNTTEYQMLHPWYLELLKSLPEKRYFLEIGIGDGSSLTQDADKQFQLGIAIEKSVELLPLIAKNCPNTHVIGKAIENVSDEEIRQLIVQNDTDFINNKTDAVFDLIQVVHVLYYLQDSEWKALFSRLASQVRVGGVIFAVLQDESSDYFGLYHHLTPHRYNLREVGEWFQSQFSNYQVTTEILEGKVISDSLEVIQQISEFMLCYLPFEPLPPRQLITKWIQDTLRDHDELYIARNPQRVLICRRLY
jgi:hypothetical protein